METIIQHIALDLVKKITKKAYSGGINDIDALASDVLVDCRKAASLVIEAIYSQINVQIREDKAERKKLGLVLKEKERKRELLTELGRLSLPRDYYYDRNNGRYVSVLDYITGIRAYERIGNNLSACMVNLATDMSYAKSAQLSCGEEVSRQTVKNHIMKVGSLEKGIESSLKKEIQELHIYADEDHVHMQKSDKEKGKKSRIVPLVTVTEGLDTDNSNRHRTRGKMHFVDEAFDTKALWKSVEGYIGKIYDLTKVEKVYVHGDGGRWIKNGLEDLPQTVHVMDGYHLEKRLKELSVRFPSRGVRSRLTEAIKAGERKKADKIVQSLYEIAEDDKESGKINEFGKYLMGNWEAIENRKTLNIPGSCTEAQVSHVLSERFSRDPLGWSDKGLGKLSKLRVYVKNGGRIKAEDFREHERNTTYREYADRVINEAMEGAIDWSIFDRRPFVFNGASGTQILLHEIACIKNTLWN